MYESLNAKMKQAQINIANVANNLSESLIVSLHQNKYWFCQGEVFCEMPFFSLEEWSQFSDCWNRLTLDQYMGDGGIYRYRRYDAIKYISHKDELELQPHIAYVQPSYINTLNGGIERHFDPIEPQFIQHRFLKGLLTWCVVAFRFLSQHQGDWDIRLHPYRILARSGTPGLPTPEGLHRDGVDYILTLMIKRQNVKGGETIITDAEENLLWKGILNLPLDIMIANDSETKHAATPIEVNEADSPSYRDVLVIAFTALKGT